MWFGGAQGIPGLSPTERQMARQHIGAQRPFVIIGGARSAGPFANRNLKSVADAIRSRGDLDVVFVGGAATLEPEVEFLFEGVATKVVPDSSPQLALHVAAAEVLVQAALGEEEGMWLHAAMTCGCPALMASWSPLHRSGNGVRFFDPTASGDLTRALDQIMSGEREVASREASARVQREILMPNHERLELVLRALAAGEPVPNVTAELGRRANAAFGVQNGTMTA
jgi:hypothetical protein